MPSGRKMSNRSKWDVLVGSDLQKHENKVVNFSSMDPPPNSFCWFLMRDIDDLQHIGFSE